MLSPPPPKPEYEVVAEGAGLFILIAAIILILLAFIVYPVQTASYLSNMLLSFANWAWDIVRGIATVAWAFISGFFHGLWNNTLGRLGL